MREGGKAQAVESVIRRNGNIGVCAWHEGSSAMLWSCDTTVNCMSDLVSKEVRHLQRAESEHRFSFSLHVGARAFQVSTYL